MVRMSTDRAQTPGARPREAAEGILPPPDPIPSSPAGASPPNCATDCDPVAALPHRAVPAGETDDGWQARDGHDSYILALQVIGGKVPHPGMP